MRNYATNEDRKSVYFWLFAISVILAWCIHFLLSGWDWQFDFMIESPATLSIFIVLYTLFNQYLWKLKPFRLWFGVSVPDLSGAWQGEAKTSHEIGNYRPELAISQTWSKINIEQDTNLSYSHSTMVMLNFGDGPTKLSYAYENIVKPAALETMSNHTGIAFFTLREQKNRTTGATVQTLMGTYYTDPTRDNSGELNFVRTF